MKTLRMPNRLDEVPQDYEVFRKDDPQSLLARFLFWAMRVGMFLRFSAAKNAWFNYHQAIGGHVYVSQGSVDRSGGRALLNESARWHEGVHLWQRKAYGVWGHQLRFALDPRGLPLPLLRHSAPWYRLNAEAQAYAIQVAHDFRDFGEALDRMTRPVYAMGSDRELARTLLRDYVTRWGVLLEQTTDEVEE